MVMALVAGVAASGCDTGATADPQSRKTKPKLQQAPNYSARELGGRKVVSIRSLRGEPVFLVSWAIWCTECRAEMPAIQKLADKYMPRGLQVFGVDVDDGGDQAPMEFVRQYHLTFPMLHDEHHNYQVAFRAVGTPQSELISRDGKIVKVWQGVFDPTDPANVKLIEAELTKRSTGSGSR